MSLSNASIGINSFELLDTNVVNLEHSNYVEITTALIILIPVVNIPIMRSVYEDSTGTFLNKLVLLDCANALLHVPIVTMQYRYTLTPYHLFLNKIEKLYDKNL